MGTNIHQGQPVIRMGDEFDKAKLIVILLHAAILNMRKTEETNRRKGKGGLNEITR
jgi:hypothetical protein